MSALENILSVHNKTFKQIKVLGLLSGGFIEGSWCVRVKDEVYQHKPP